MDNKRNTNGYQGNQDYHEIINSLNEDLQRLNNRIKYFRDKYKLPVEKIEPFSMSVTTTAIVRDKHGNIKSKETVTN